MDPKIEADFLKKKARDLPVEYVQDWYDAAYDDSIEHDHVAWFLPRVLEMLADGQSIWLGGHEVTLSRLPLAGFPDRWRADEVATVAQFAHAFFAALLADQIPNADPEIDSWLCMFGLGGLDVTPLLAQLDALPDAKLIEVLHREWVTPYLPEVSMGFFWKDDPAKQQVWNWYISDALLARMERAALAGCTEAVDLYDLIVAAQLKGRP